MEKMTVEEIRERFDNQVDFYSEEDRGQPSIVDSDIVLDMMMDSIALLRPPESICDIGCGAGNFALRTLRVHPDAEVSLVDLSRNMLDRAESKVRDRGGKIGAVIQGDIRDIALEPASQDIILSGAALHHLRNADQWFSVLRMIRRALKPGGSFWYWDLIEQDHSVLQQVQHRRWGEYLSKTFDEQTRDQIFDYCEREDSPRSISFIGQKMTEAGFLRWDVIHKNSLFAAMVAFRD